ncbi:hypothetical protein [Acetobacter oeni]|uniref:Uncharacterized protein n=1 Tax=Acetobacter oeni TaxID=304077 RepID=A0A511XLN4_9PROT|nr:hypothetical protein [Acetobacter oeni]MBB3883629.1 hypothetical protein [Acetobacter oeni]NHO19636.1 hypothetical protein [Acetobacter oeni]GBR04705.1 hypothetical protein AA21952_1504 [Acetobacter oeni LMG 21952]GEN63834.1 hypothetical protein AOE01nite_20580 [Acetobacter oeni]
MPGVSGEPLRAIGGVQGGYAARAELIDWLKRFLIMKGVFLSGLFWFRAVTWLSGADVGCGMPGQLRRSGGG